MLLAVLVIGTPLPSPGDPAPDQAWGYQRICDDLLRLEPDPARIARVQNLVLVRDAGVLSLEEGTLALGRPVGGRVCAAFFSGRVRFRFTPTEPVEREQLRRYYREPELSREFSSLLLLFADSTAQQLERAVGFAPGRISFAPWIVTAHLRGFVTEKTRYVDPSFARTLLERRHNAHFVAALSGSQGDRLRFEIDPYQTEEVTLSRVSDGAVVPTEIISKFRLGGQSSRSLERDDRPGFATSAYAIDVRIQENLVPRYVCDLEAEVLEDSIRFLPFDLLEIQDQPDSAIVDGRPRPVFCFRDNPVVWVDAGRSLRRGERFRLRLRYTGKTLGEYGGMVGLRSSIFWYPVHGARHRATFDLRFRHPSRVTLVSVGDLVERLEQDGVTTSRWRSAEPIRNASWHLGLFKQATVEGDSTPSVTALIHEVDHTRIGRVLLEEEGIASGTNMEKAVANDVVGAMTFFRHVYGALPNRRFYAAESRAVEGEAFPGMITLGWKTFQWTDSWGDDEVLRAHEVAHQWWPVLADYETYRDRWLSEGLAEFSGLWYMQVKRRKYDLYLRTLGEMRERILGHRDAGSTWLGHRVETPKTDGPDYRIAIYDKGAWVFHMLRNLLIDLDTMKEDRFVELMRDVFATHRGGTVSTADFQALATRHVGEDMEWFFRQWVEWTAIPRYRVSWSVRPAGTGQHRLTLHVKQEDVPEGFRMAVPIRIDLPDGSYARTRVWVDKPSADIELPVVPEVPRHVEFNEFSSVLCVVEASGRR
jgi:hypothetical protein